MQGYVLIILQFVALVLIGINQYMLLKRLERTEDNALLGRVYGTLAIKEIYLKEKVSADE